jgi:hypothetical protein
VKSSVLTFLAALICVASLATTPAAAKAPAGPQPEEPTYDGGDGLSKQNAVIIHSGSETSGTQAEYAWLKKHYPGSTPISQGLTPWDSDGKRYQRVTIHTSSGDDVVVWFEISALFRKND